jgi:uncharacterized protein YggE
MSAASVAVLSLMFVVQAAAQEEIAARGQTQAGRPAGMVAAPPAGTTRVVVSGDSLVQARPDTATISVAVVTQAQTALAAQQENARRSETMVRALKSAAGAGAEVETSGYSLQPQYNYRENQTPVIRGYEARNTVTVTLGDLSKVGPVIDAATNAGANNIDNLAFTLRRDEPARDQALAAATREALRKAQVMAVALGGRVGRIVEVQEASAGRPVPMYDMSERARGAVASKAMAQTPVEIGTLDIRAQVQLVAEIITER